MDNHIAKMLVASHAENQAVQIYISDKDEQLGQLVILAEVKTAADHNKKIIKQIIDETRDAYFNSLAKDSEKALEDTLQKINFSLSENLKITGKEWLDSSNVAIISVKDQNVHFSKIGKISALLISHKKIISITESNVDEEINPVKIFANIYSGILPEQSTIWFMIDNLLDYVSQEKLRKISEDGADQDVAQIIKELEQLVKPANSPKNFAVVAVKYDNLDQLKPSTNQDETAVSSISQPMSIEQPDNQKDLSPAADHFNRPAARRPLRHLGKWPILIGAGIIAVILIAWVAIKLLSAPQVLVAPPTTPPPATNPQFDIQLNVIQTKFIAAQDLLIANQATAAATLLREVAGLVDALPAQTPAQDQDKIALAKKTATQLLLAQGVDLTQPTLLSEITGYVPQKLIYRENNLYLLGADHNVYRYDLVANQMSKVDAVANSVGELTTLIDQSGPAIYLYHALDGLAELNLETKQLKSLEWVRSWTGAPRSANIYQNKLYVISGSSKLFKYTSSITGFTQEVDWLKDTATADLTKAIDLAIDGTLWIGQADGSIIKLYKGERQDFSYTVNPPVARAIRVITDLDWKNIYLLDADTSRIIVIDKSGKLIKQVTAAEFINPTDMAVDESKAKIYLLDQDKIFEIGI